MINTFSRFKRGLAVFTVVLLSLSLAETAAKSFSIGVIADCQYCSDPGAGKRKYSLSEKKLQECIDHLNTMDLAYVIHLGDFIDKDFESFEVVAPIYNQLNAPHYHVLGNHDFSVDDSLKAEVPERLGLTSRYYDFEMHGWRFVVLDGNDVSFHAHPEGSAEYLKAEQYYNENQITSPKWNGAIGEEQLSWLKQTLDQAERAGEKVILYSHFPVYPENNHNSWNAKEIVSLLSGYECVKVYMNGHNHAGNYANRDGIHYMTMKGMVDTTETAYSVVEINEDSLEVRGYGREEDRVLELR